MHVRTHYRNLIMEKKFIDHFCHQHPLFFTENASDRETLGCYGCGNPVTSLEAAYVCMQQYCSDIILHKRCGELPSQILHPRHPQHSLHLFYYHHSNITAWCDLCSHNLNMKFGYQCLDGCDFDIDITCEKLSIDLLLEEKRELQHPSHPHHHLTLMRKHAFAFCCDGCGAQDVDMAYICSTCEFWIHKSCALLPPILPTNHQYHHHHLSLAFSFPTEHRYADFRYKCDVCNKGFDTTCWLYFCGDCRFFAHIKCVTTTTQSMKQDSNIDEDDYDGSSVIQFPLYAHDIIKELITPFVMREKGLNKIPDVKDMPTTINIPETITSFSFLFNYHKHPLSLVSESSHENINKIMYGEEDEDEDDDEDEDGESDDELKICDICVTPICSPPYYECIDCKYFVHSICYLLPKTLSSSFSFNSLLYGGCPITHNTTHKFTLYTSSEWQDRENKMYRCALCEFVTNGMVYECEGCKVKIDVKCASLPSRIKHASHQHHKPLIMIRLSQEDRGRWKKCHGCEDDFDVGYCCSSEDCDFAMDFKCAMLPQSIRKHEWDNHPLLLSFDASLDHPTYFVCEFCEEELHPKKWMYHCRQCDHSFHLFCPKIGSGWYRNIKFGRRFVLDGIHAHALTIRCVTVRKWCSICCIEVYNYCGLECESCYYVVCLVCTAKIVKKIELVGDVSSSSD